MGCGNVSVPSYMLRPFTIMVLFVAPFSTSYERGGHAVNVCVLLDVACSSTVKFSSRPSTVLTLQKSVGRPVGCRSQMISLRSGQ